MYTESDKEITRMLNNLLANQYVLYAKTYAFHWNVTGQNFYQLHELFEEQYTSIAEYIDQTAERIRQLGQKVEAGLQVFLDRAELQESDSTTLTKEQMIEILAKDHKKVAFMLREMVEKVEESGDKATSDLLTGFALTHEKFVWMLSSSLK